MLIQEYTSDGIFLAIAVLVTAGVAIRLIQLGIKLYRLNKAISATRADINATELS